MLNVVSIDSGTLSRRTACGHVKTTVSSAKTPAAVQPEIRGRPSLARFTTLLGLRACQLRDSSERRLGGVQPEREVLVGERLEQIGRLMPVRVPARAGMHA